MVKKLMVVFFLITLAAAPVYADTAEADDGENMRLYVGGRAIMDALKVTGSDEATEGMSATTMQFGAGVSAGTYKRVKNAAFRFEVDYSYTMRSNSFYHAIMANVYIQSAYKAHIFAPYIMAGIGMNVFDPPFANIESAFAFNTGAGIVVPVKGGWAVDFGFRYMQSNINFHTEEATQKVKNHNFYIGALYVF